MGENLKSRRRSTGLPGGLRWLDPVCLLALAFVLAAPLQPLAADEGASPATMAEAQEAAPRTIERLQLQEGSPATVLEVTSDQALVWTSYRDGDGNLVIELPNSAPAPAASGLSRGTGLVSTVDVELDEEGLRPLTRLTVKTRRDADHKLSASGVSLLLELTPVDVEPVVADAGGAGETDDSLLPLPSEPQPEAPAGASQPPTTYVPAEDGLEITRSQHPVSNPATMLQGVTLESASEGTVLKIRGDGGFSYSSFQLQNPDRFVVDLSGVINASPRSTVPVASASVERVRIAQFKPYPEPISRVVFDLSTGSEPQLVPVADGLVVRFGGARLAGVDAAPPVRTVSPSRPEAPTIVSTESQMEASVEQAWGTETAVADSGAADGGVPPATPYGEAEPIQVVTLSEDAEAPQPQAYEEDRTSLEPEPAGPPTLETERAMAGEKPMMTAPHFESPKPPTTDVSLFEAAQVQYEEIRERAEPTATRVDAEVVSSGDKVFTGEPITMSLKDADIKDVLRSFSGITGLNVVVHPGVKGSVTVELKEVPWDQALDLILKINNLDFVLEGNIMRIASTQQLEEEAQARRRLAAARAQEVPLTTMIRSISYANAAQVARLLTTSSGGSRGRGGRSNRSSILSSRGSVTVDARTNKLIIKELPGNMSTVLAIIDNLDTAEPQVLIEARIVETTKSFSRTLGINWSFNAVADDQFGNTSGLQFPHRGSANGGVNLLTGGNNGFLDISLGNILDTFTLDASLQAAENEGLVTILSEPKIATLNNQRATIQSGLQIPIQTVANNTVTVQFVNATLSLEVTPQVTAEGTVLMDINIAKREPQLAFAIAGAANAPISTKQAQTRVIVRDGGTTVIGGIYEVSNNRGEDRVPGLANIPVLGHLFKNRRRNNDNEELLIFITPRVIQL